MNRSELRHACFRAKNNAITPDKQHFLNAVEPLLSPGQNWDNFTKVWDLLVTKTGKIVIIKPETDYDFIHSTCLKANIYALRDLEFDFSDREANIITIVEIMMLEGLMKWKTYNTDWGIIIDTELGVIRTKLYNRPTNQIDVTSKMIEDSKIDTTQPILIPITSSNIDNSITVTVTDPKEISEEQAQSIIKKLS